MSFAGVFPWFLTITTEVIFSPISSKLEAFRWSQNIWTKMVFLGKYFETDPFWPFEEILMANKWQEYKKDLFLLRFEVQIHKRSHQMKMELYLHLHTYYSNRSEHLFLSKVRDPTWSVDRSVRVGRPHGDSLIVTIDYLQKVLWLVDEVILSLLPILDVLFYDSIFQCFHLLLMIMCCR